MDKRILVAGSILAVAILIGVSFTSVVGYSNNNSNSISVSPLYNIRTNRAIDNSNDVTTCDYVGKGKGLTIPISEYDNLEALRQQLLDKIKGMNEIELKALGKSIIRLLNNKKFIEEVKRDNYMNYPLEFTFEDDPETCSNFLCFIEAILAYIILLGMALFVSIAAIIMFLIIVLSGGIAFIIYLWLIKNGLSQDCWTGMPTYCDFDSQNCCN